MLADGVAEGRRIFANTIKYVLMGTSSNFGNMFSAAGASLFLPFLPMLPSQILLNNLLYDASQLAIPTDNVDEEQLRRPSHWDIGFIRRFMLFFGPLSSLFDFVTFARHAVGLPRRAGAVPHRLVRRVPGHPDAGHLRHPHPADPVLPQPPQPAADPGAPSASSPSARCCPPRRSRRTSGFTPLPVGFFAALAGMVAGLPRPDRGRQALFYRHADRPVAGHDPDRVGGTCGAAPPTSPPAALLLHGRAELPRHG